MFRRLTLLLLLIAVASASCSRNPERPSASSPTAPSAVAGSLPGSSAVAPGGGSGPMALSIPGRTDLFDFFVQLDAKYRDGLGRGPSSTFVDREGVVVWILEYIRYRVNGCDHGSATQRVFAQIEGNTPGAVCGAEPTGEIQLPSRADVLEFRRALETRYQGMGRGLNASFVDLEGSAVWFREYLRYRLNGCSHAVAMEKVFSEIDGRGTAATCFAPPAPAPGAPAGSCNYRLTPGSRNFGGSGGTFEFEIFHIGGPACTWTATSDSSFVTITPPTSAEGNQRLRYRVAVNGGSNSRSAKIRIDWNGGSTEHLVFQSGSDLALSIALSDPFRSGTASTDSCHIKTASTPCTLTASANIQGTSTFAWTVTYPYPNTITHTQTSTSNVFTFTQQCGGGTSTAAGFGVPMSVSLTVTDPTAALTQTISREFQIVLYTCP